MEQVQTIHKGTNMCSHIDMESHASRSSCWPYA